MEILETISTLVKVIGSVILFVGIPFALLMLLVTLFEQSGVKKRKAKERLYQIKISEENTQKNNILAVERARKKLEKEAENQQKISHLKTKLGDIFLSTWGRYQALGDGTRIDKMKGVEFEKFVGKLFVSMGYEITFTTINNDQGTDIIAKKNKDKTSIQVKRYKKSVGNSAVQEALAGAHFHNCNKTCVVTNSTFTKSAKELAKRSNTELIDRKKLFSLIEIYITEKENEEYSYDNFIKNETAIFSFFPEMRRLVRSVEMEIEHLDRNSNSHSYIPRRKVKKKIKQKPNKCPRCGSKKIADIFYGMPDYSQIQEELKAGIIVLGGCVITGNDPKWVCTSCDKKI